MPLVSIVIPTYNRARMLDKSIGSILQQTFKDYEIIVVDDNSTDDTRIVVEKLNDSRIKYYRNEINLGAAGSRNVGMANSHGEYIAFQDSDDEWLPKKLEILLRILEKSSDNTGMIFSDVERVELNGRITIYPIRSQTIDTNNLLKEFLFNNLTPTPAIMIRKKCFEEIGGFDPDFKCYEDYDFVIRISKKYNVLYHPEVLVRQYESEGGVDSPQYRIRAEMQKLILEKHFEDYLKNGRLMAERCFRIGDYYCLSKEYKEGLKYFKKAFESSKVPVPYYIKYYLAFASNVFGLNVYSTIGGVLSSIKGLIESK